MFKKLVKIGIVTSLLCSFSSFANDNSIIRLATTTSTYHSGLLEHLFPTFENETGYKVQIFAQGTGKSLKMGESGDVDLVMTHAPKAEQKFIDDGFGILPRQLMYNDFIIVGPNNDPAKIKDTHNATAALKAIANSDSIFVSRGDDSGTNKKELNLWSKLNIKPDFDQYRSAGQGMGPVLIMTSEFQGYTLTDRGTWLAYQDKLDLELMVEGDKALFNPYQVIIVNPKLYPSLNTKGARALSDWLVGNEAQAIINNYKVKGQKLFTANANAK
ncbi:substrate-binding domain-containing protein [Vibrio sp. SS-MA-C1-2]|uniref:substrate-binding domain-containing protein n=1 Tax=Vibrio sp. SS-MA-C1-2 TaxID=2908646 RepID=UPI001F23D874|nr:substrate-binding domain-containing protein [Vibrio sp. SS-MA-C1-2]UJF18153.1 substrate-binding domain-containing protein [Vibrio sp. SS-MA-C1-2]